MAVTNNNPWYGQQWHLEGTRPNTIVVDDPEGSIGLELGLKHYQVRIKKVSNGFIVKVGCKTFVSQSWKEVYVELGKYWRDPKAAEKKWDK